MIRKRELIYIAISCIITIFLLLLSPKHNFTPKGIYLPNPNSMIDNSIKTNKKTIKPEDVKITRYPPNTEKSATINIIKHFKALTPEANNKNNMAILKVAKEIAAKNGANLLLLVGAFQSPFVGPLDEIQMNFYAYKI